MMNSKDVFDNVVKPKLTEVFGSFMSSAISSNGFSTAMTEMAKMGTSSDTYKLVIESICLNQQVLAMWGSDGTNKQKDEWLSLIN